MLVTSKASTQMVCKRIPLEFIYSDSSFWKKDSMQIVKMVKQAEEIANKGKNLNKKFIFPISFIKKVTDTNYIFGKGLPYHQKGWIQKLGTQFLTYKLKNMTDTSAVSIYLGDSRMFTTNIPTIMPTGWRICRPNEPWSNQASVIAKYDSISPSFDHPWYSALLAHTIFDLLGVTNEPADGTLMTNNIWTITDSVTANTVGSLNLKSITCKENVICFTNNNNLKNNSDDDIQIYDRVIHNPNKKIVTLLAIDGRVIYSSRDENITLEHFPHGIILIKTNKKSIKKIL
ncbi:MAG TPA: hypothetical protein PLW93_02450 [Candidatus Absconditabacterales bacterium]|nr:hypothetical protein [Candidatus Absconditabacterales bacterium]HNG97109.1 hypothetical protein [Candidatus Absconditabacterales bacterium]